MSKKIFFIILLSLLGLPIFVFAEGNVPTVQNMIDAAVTSTLYIASGVVVILWVITGFLFLTGQGAPDRLVLARKALVAAVSGTVLIILAQSGMWVAGSLFGITDLINGA